MFQAPGAPATATDDATGEAIENYEFFPAIEVDKFREAMRVDSVATLERIKQALYSAMLDVNRNLSDWMQEQQKGGITAIADVVEAPGIPATATQQRYFMAVYSLAKAFLNEQLNDYSRDDDAEGETENANVLRRNASWYISNITGRTRVTVELI